MKSSVEEPESFVKSTNDKDKIKHGMKIFWPLTIHLVTLHILSIYGSSYIFQVKKETIIFSYVLFIMSGLGITAGTHRLWSHRAYKARLPLKLFLVFCQTLALQLSVIEWCRDHRSHHKFSDTDADPHDSNRGFFFSHIGWLLCKRSVLVKNARNTIDYSDLEADPILSFQKRYYFSLMIVISLVLPTMIPVLLFNESYLVSFLFAFACRVTVVYHFSFLVNSVAHLWGNRPYDKNIKPRDNVIVSFIAFGEGYHNYHHTFPWDYSTSELGSRVNFTTLFLNIMALCGQAYDLRKPTPETIKNRCKRTGENNEFGTQSLGMMSSG